MCGITYPEKWEEIIKNSVFNEPAQISYGRLKKELIKSLRDSIRPFKNEGFCVALSGGVDSSVLVALLTTINVEFTAVTIGFGKVHKDIVFAKLMQKTFGFKHKIAVLSGERLSVDAYDDLFREISGFGFKNTICADTVDEILGGYWMHRRPEVLAPDDCADKQAWVFEKIWKDLPKLHLQPMNYYAKKHGITVSLPYLGANKILRKVAINQRVDENNGKIILRELARNIRIPDEIIKRPKLGLCSIWDK